MNNLYPSRPHEEVPDTLQNYNFPVSSVSSKEMRIIVIFSLNTGGNKSGHSPQQAEIVKGGAKFLYV